MKKGISLIVLVITIIVMIILASSVVISLNNTGIIDKANQAVNLSNEKQVQDIAALVWLDAYMNNFRDQGLVNEVIEKLEEQGITEDEWEIDVTNTGVSVISKENPGPTLGSLIENAGDYGKLINYEANGVTEWQVFYHTDDYVYIIAKEALGAGKTPTVLQTTHKATITTATITLSDGSQRTLDRIYWNAPPVGVSVAANVSEKWMANWGDYTGNANARQASYFLDETIWSAYQNTTAKYKKYILGAIGTPTAEMLVASWNKRAAYERSIGNSTIYTADVTLTVKENVGYDSTSGFIQLQPYAWCLLEGAAIWLASPGDSNSVSMMYIGGSGTYSHIFDVTYTNQYMSVRPVVCLNAKMPASIDSDGNFVI